MNELGVMLSMMLAAGNKWQREPSRFPASKHNTKKTKARRKKGSKQRKINRRK